MTQKLIEFTKEEKSLIWQTKLQPNKANESEANVFIKVCEELGLNPLLGDINFQKFETKYGPRVSYLITRDARLKHAMRQDDYVNMLSGVVKEGDFFEVDAMQGVPVHKFGSKRGKIIGAWALVKTKTRGNTIVFPDFDEYQKALSPKNPVWNTMPSAMIEKVAQSQALSRTFPLGLVFASEEEIVDVNVDIQSDTPAGQQEDKQNTSLVDELKQARDQKEDIKDETAKSQNKRQRTQKAQKDETSKKETASTDNAAKEAKEQEQTPVQQTPVQEEKTVEETKAVDTPVDPFEETKESVTEETNQEETIEQVSSASEEDSNVLEYVDGVLGKSGNNTPFLRVKYNANGITKEAFARGEGVISLFDEYEPGTKFKAQIQEMNGFTFFLSAQAV